jgi:hypothetical protein
MGFYAGIDLHTRKSVVCVIDQKERKRVMATAPNELPCILSLLRKVPRRPTVAVEATLNWYCVLSLFPTTVGRLKNLHRYIYPRGKVADYHDLHDVRNSSRFEI